MTDIVERLRSCASDDHERGCQGRCYDCSCGYDAKRDPLLNEAADTIERLRAALSGVVREWEEYRSDGWDGDVPFIVGVTMAGIARAALNNGEKQ